MSASVDAPVQLKWWGLTDKGPFRKNNEDAFLALTYDPREVRLLGKEGESSMAIGDFIFAVSDGMGGANAGEFASRIAVQKITESFPRHFQSGRAPDPEFGKQMLERLFLHIHHAVQEMGRHYDECSGMGATLSLLWLSARRGYICHVGDSRIYRMRADGELTRLTRDHTYADTLYRTGKINEREARNHPQKNQLEMVMGGRQKCFQPQLEVIEIQPGERFLLCTDGLIDGLWDNSIRTLLHHPVARLAAISPARRLISEALAVSGRDNTTAIVVELHPDPSET